MMCSRCKKRVAVVYMTRLDGDKTINEGLCLQCARELGIKPINDLVDKMGLTDEDMAQMDDQLLEMINPEGDDNFEMGGAQPFPFSLVISAPIWVSGVMIRFIGRDSMEASPSKTEEKS